MGTPMTMVVAPGWRTTVPGPHVAEAERSIATTAGEGARRAGKEAVALTLIVAVVEVEVQIRRDTRKITMKGTPVRHLTASGCVSRSSCR